MRPARRQASDLAITTSERTSATLRLSGASSRTADQVSVMDCDEEP